MVPRFGRSCGGNAMGAGSGSSGGKSSRGGGSSRCGKNGGGGARRISGISAGGRGGLLKMLSKICAGDVAGERSTGSASMAAATGGARRRAIETGQNGRQESAPNAARLTRGIRRRKGGRR